MPDRPSRRLILLEAYEDFTRREEVCLREENFESLEKVQLKKAKVLEDLLGLQDEPNDEEKAIFNERLALLQKREADNARALQEKMASNRQEHRRLTVNAVSATKLRRVYAPPSSSHTAPRSLKGKA